MNFKAQIKNVESFRGSIQTLIESDYKKLFKLENNDYIHIETWKERNVQFLRKYFALMKCVIYHLPESVADEFHNIDNIRRYITINTGRYDLIPSLTGEPIPQAKSISFKNMDEDEFNSLYQDSLNIILKYFLKDISLEDFELDIQNFL